ncbi:MAG TPA: serine/threonine dehydratase [Chloroflexota bacterium]|nr:serine/threonine dehydratase [Chloroflexota bacterium]
MSDASAWAIEATASTYNPSAMRSVTPADVRAAATRIAPYVRRTPVLPLGSTTRGQLDWDVVLKLENLQVAGSFKPRGALNALLERHARAIERGVVTASGGNHGLGVAYAARRLEARATVYVPETTPVVKRERIAAWGAEVRLVGREYSAAAEAAHADAERTGRVYVHAYADAAVIAGQGTVALEFVEDAPGPLDYLLVAVGGGGLIAGMATCLRETRVSVIGVEPNGAPTLHSALAAGGPVDLERLESVAADSLGARRVGELNYELARAHVSRVALVSDSQILAAQRFLWEETQTMAEPGGAAALAALLSRSAQIPRGARVGVLVCGGNAEPGMRNEE